MQFCDEASCANYFDWLCAKRHPFANGAVTEIICHAKGAHFLMPDVRTVIDIGGQDSKVIRVDETGDVTDFVMNDKCAAGTGRFFEVIADYGQISPPRR
jgi:activator of 2-hydroxyglutaryl-CoA dehydratase